MPTKKSLKDVHCSIAQFAEIMGDKWSLLIVRDALIGIETFSGFEKSLGVAKNVLAERLAHLIAHGILIREQTRPGVERYVYRLTEKGKALFPVGTAIMQWSDKWVYGSEGEPVKVVDTKSGAPVQEIGVMSRDGRFLTREDIAYVPGPGRERQLNG